MRGFSGLVLGWVVDPELSAERGLPVVLNALLRMVAIPDIVNQQGFREPLSWYNSLV